MKKNDPLNINAGPVKKNGGDPYAERHLPTIRAGMKLTDEQKSFTDVLGSWTGVPTDETYPVPVQDADDL